MNSKTIYRLRTWSVALVLLACLAISTWRIQQFNYRPYLYQTLYLPSGKFINELSLGYKQLVADVIWLSVIQYYGDYRRDNHDLTYFTGLIDIITTLDPHFIFAYVFGGMVVSEDTGEFDSGIGILKKGMANNPTSWKLPFEIGFLNYVNGESYPMAARYFDLASRMPGTPDYAKRFAAVVYSKAGRYSTSMRMWEEYRDNTDDPILKDLATRYLEKLKARQKAEKEINANVP
jgi:hypothetical protein